MTMPLLETDLLYALLDDHDRHHQIAEKLFERIRRFEVKPVPQVSGLSLLELEVILKSGLVEVRGRTASDHDIAEYFKKVCEALRLYGIETNPLTCESIVLAASMRFNYNLSYYDSHYAAQAQALDQHIISTDRVYDRVREIKRIKPESLL